MASITISGIDTDLERRLNAHAERHGHSIEEEVRDILKQFLKIDVLPDKNLAEAIHATFLPFGGVELPELERSLVGDPPSFDL